MEELHNENARAASQTPNQSTLDAHRLLVMWLFISTVTIGLGFLALVLYFYVTGRGGLTIMIAVIVAGAGGGFVSSLRRLYSFEDVFPRREYVQLFSKLNFYVIAYSLVPAVVGMRTFGSPAKLERRTVRTSSPKPSARSRASVLGSSTGSASRPTSRPPGRRRGRSAAA